MSEWCYNEAKLQIFGFSTEILFNFLYLDKTPWEMLMITLRHVEKLASGFNYNFALYLMFLYPLKIVQGPKNMENE